MKMTVKKLARIFRNALFPAQAQPPVELEFTPTSTPGLVEVRMKGEGEPCTRRSFILTSPREYAFRKNNP
jgi:hypothetical protein